MRRPFDGHALGTHSSKETSSGSLVSHANRLLAHRLSLNKDPETCRCVYKLQNVHQRTVASFVFTCRRRRVREVFEATLPGAAAAAAAAAAPVIAPAVFSVFQRWSNNLIKEICHFEHLQLVWNGPVIEFQ